MKHRLRRRYGLGQLHFITCSCYRRMPLLGTERARHLFLKVLSEVRERYDFALIGYVVMPEHIHLLISEPNVGNPSTVMQVLKQRVSRAMRPATEKTHALGTDVPMGRGSCEEIPTVLATTVLRLQCVEHEEKERKDELHAFQSGEERVGGASERLALE